MANDIAPEISAVPVRILYESDRILAATTFRGDCDEADPYSGFSVCHYVGDREEHWRACRSRLAAFTGVDAAHIIVPRQTHSLNVVSVTSVPSSPDALDNVDGVATDVAGIVVGVNTADCVPLLLLHEEKGVVAAVHAGWRGAAGGIIENALEEMERLGASAEGIKAIIAPHIGACCFEVGEEVAEKFHPDDVHRIVGRKPHVDLTASIVRRLTAAGVSGNCIMDDGMCTRCHPESYFSARAQGVASGRNFTFIMLKKFY